MPTYCIPKLASRRVIIGDSHCQWVHSTKELQISEDLIRTGRQMQERKNEASVGPRLATSVVIYRGRGALATGHGTRDTIQGTS